MSPDNRSRMEINASTPNYKERAGSVPKSIRSEPWFHDRSSLELTVHGQRSTK